MLSDDIISVSDDHFRFSYGPTIHSFNAQIKLPSGPMRHSDGPAML